MKNSTTKIVAQIIAALAAIIVAIIWNWGSLFHINGSTLIDNAITSPTSGSSVQSEFIATGRLHISQHEVGWIVVRKGNLYWPKEPSIKSNGIWERKVYEGGPKGKFDLVLIAVSTDINNEFEKWFINSHNSGQYNGIPKPTGIRILAEIALYKE